MIDTTTAFERRPGLYLDGLCIDDILPRIIVPPWQDLGVFAFANGTWSRQFYRGSPPRGLNVLVTLDGARAEHGLWLHASISRARSLPSWDDVVDAKGVVFEDRPVVQVLPPRKYWVNHHPFCLHLFERLDRETVPEALWKLM